MANCTRHGGWTAWSDWGACSATCDSGIKVRRRTCENPSPRFGGKKCVGRDTDDQLCTGLPKCGEGSGGSTAAAVTTGRWGSWGEWSECSADCGRGFMTRKREQVSEGLVSGCDTEYSECEGREGCAGVSDVTDWTPWVKTNTSVGDSWYEKRFRFSYRAPVSLEGSGRPVIEERFCEPSGRCSMTSINQPRASEDGRGPWTEWSQCSRECGSGYQLRARECSRDQYGECREGGMTVSERPCNTEPCRGEWSCWTEWSECRGSSGVRRRSRECSTKGGLAPGSSGVSCQGGISFEEAPCDGGSGWGDWGHCGADGKKTRVSLSGAETQTRPCDEGDEVSVQKTSGGGASGVVAACVCCFILGALAGAVAVYYLLLRRGRGVGGAGGGPAGSPHYVSAKSQNLYVSLPMLDLKHRGGAGHGHHPLSSNQSDCSTLRSTTTAGTGTLRSIRGGDRERGGGGGGHHKSPPVVDYETATIKRSHSQRNSTLLAGERVGASSMRADLDSDQLFT